MSWLIPMSRLVQVHRIIPFILTALALALSHGTASANGIVRYVSTSGSNSNDCLRQTPCLRLPTALSKTPEGGEIRVLKSGYYGANVTITKSITISGERPDVTLSNIELTINAPGKVISIRHLHLANAGSQGTGINVIAARHVNVEHCVVQGFLDRGISSDGADELYIANSTVRDTANGIGMVISGGKLAMSRSRVTGSGDHGIYLQNGVGASLSHVVVAGNRDGIYITSSSKVSISHSVSSGNSSEGIVVHSGTASIASTVLRGNGNDGLEVNASGTARISNLMIVDNVVGVNNDGTLETLGNNFIHGNTTNKQGNALTPIAAE